MNQISRFATLTALSLLATQVSAKDTTASTPAIAHAHPSGLVEVASAPQEAAVSGSLKIGHHTLPLPEGKWTIVSETSELSKRGATKKRKGNPDHHHPDVKKILLAQVVNGQLVGFINVETNDGAIAEGFSGPDVVKVKDSYHVENFYVPGSAGNKSTLSVEPHVYKPSDFGGALKEFAKKQGLALKPGATFANVKFQMGTFGSFMNVSYSFNPQAQGVQLNAADAKAGFWAQAEDHLSQEEVTFLKKTKAWALGFKEKVEAGFQS